jgi:hypothetical protein
MRLIELTNNIAFLREFKIGSKTLNSVLTDPDLLIGFEFEACMPSQAPKEKIKIDDMSYADLIKYFNWVPISHKNFEKLHNRFDQQSGKMSSKNTFLSTIGPKTLISTLLLTPNYGANIKDDFLYIHEPNGYTNQLRHYNLLADALKEYGYNVEVSTGYHIVTKTKDSWYIEDDPSIDAKKHDISVEIVSPPLPINEAMTALDRVYSILEKYHCYTNSTTGLHVNISIAGTPAIDFLKLLVFLGEKYVADMFDRLDNENAVLHLKKIRSSIDVANQYNPVSALSTDKMLQFMAKSLIKNKYASFNMAHYEDAGYVEFRIIGGEYLNIRDQVEDTIKRFAVMMRVATNPELYRNEYLKKVYNLINNANFHKRKIEPTDPFSKKLKRIFNINSTILTYYTRFINHPDEGTFYDLIEGISKFLPMNTQLTKIEQETLKLLAKRYRINLDNIKDDSAGGGETVGDILNI